MRFFLCVVLLCSFPATSFASGSGSITILEPYYALQIKQTFRKLMRSHQRKRYMQWVHKRSLLQDVPWARILVMLVPKGGKKRRNDRIQEIRNLLY